jgi:hypothetical protein
MVFWRSLLWFCLAGFLVLVLGSAVAQQELDMPVPKESRIREISAMLPREPRGLGAPIRERTVWERLDRRPKAKAVISQAESYRNQLTPQVDRELWKSFVDGAIERQDYERHYDLLTRRFGTFVLAEMLENEGRFLAAVEKELKALLSLGTWTNPTHACNQDLDYWEGRKHFVDLWAAINAYMAATADYWLNDKLDADLRQHLRDYLEKEIFQPYLELLNTEEQDWWWMTACRQQAGRLAPG